MKNIGDDLIMPNKIDFNEPETTDFDMILKLKSKKAISNVSSLYNYEFTDSNKNVFNLEFQSTNLVAGDICKVRSVSMM